MRSDSREIEQVYFSPPELFLAGRRDWPVASVGTPVFHCTSQVYCSSRRSMMATLLPPLFVSILWRECFQTGDLMGGQSPWPWLTRYQAFGFRVTDPDYSPLASSFAVYWCLEPRTWVMRAFLTATGKMAAGPRGFLKLAGKPAPHWADEAAFGPFLFERVGGSNGGDDAGWPRA